MRKSASVMPGIGCEVEVEASSGREGRVRRVRAGMWSSLSSLALAVAGSSGCYVDVMAGAQSTLGTTTTRLEAPAWSLGVAVGVMSDFANYTEGEVPFAMGFGWGPDQIAAEGASGPDGVATQDHDVGRWHFGLEVGLAHSHQKIPSLWWSAAGALAWSDTLVETRPAGGGGGIAQGGFGWSAMTGPVLRLGFDDISVRVYFEAKLSGTSVDAGDTTFFGGQVRVRLHDWRVLIVGGLFDGLARAQGSSGGGGSQEGDPDARSRDINTRAIDERNREQQRRVQCGGQGRDSSGARCP